MLRKRIAFGCGRTFPLDYVVQTDRGQRLDTHPLQATAIRSAKKQPAEKREVLAGVYTGIRGRYSSWRAEFHSQIGKPEDYSEDATEYGTFTMVNSYRQSSRDAKFAHEVHVRGNYHLYAPGAVNNDDWLLVCTDVVFGERDQSPQQSLATRVLPYEAFMVKFFDRSYSAFRLEWSTVGESAWAGVTQLTFERPAAERPATRQYRRSAPAVQPRRDSARPRRMLADAAAPNETRTRTPRPQPASFVVASKSPRERRSRLGTWRKPQLRWLKGW